MLSMFGILFWSISCYLGFVENFNSVQSSQDKPGEESQHGLREEALVLLKEICKHSKEGLQADAILSFPKLVAVMNVLNQENIVNFHQMIMNEALCPGNPYFM